MGSIMPDCASKRPLRTFPRLRDWIALGPESLYHFWYMTGSAGMNGGQASPGSAGAVLSVRHKPGTGAGMVARLDKEDRQTIGLDLMRVQFGWPIGMPLVRNLKDGMWERFRVTELPA
jgi:hypothetical protein